MAALQFKAQPFIVDERMAKVLGNAWGEKTMSAALCEFVRLFVIRFGGQATALMRDGPTLVFAPEKVRDLAEFLKLLHGYFARRFRSPYGLQEPLESVRWSITAGRYKCEISLLEQVPHYHSDTNQFHYRDGRPYPYEIGNTPRIFVTPYNRPEFERSDDTDDLCAFLAATASQVSFSFTGTARDGVLELAPDRVRLRALRRQIVIHYDLERIGDRCDPQQGTLLDP